MEAGNPFAPPGARVEDVALKSSGYQPVRLWPASGRIGRLRFLAYSLGLYVLFIALTFVLGLVAGLMRGSSGTVGILFGVVELVVYLVGSAILLIQRSHDMDFSGWWSLAAIIPLVGLIWVFKGGTRGDNRWGAPPPPNGVGVTILGLLFPMLMVLGIVAAVALPAYSDYTKRANGGVVGH